MKIFLVLFLWVPRLMMAAPCDVDLFAGTLTPGYSGDGGPATAAMLDQPASVAVDSAGNVYFSDKNNHRLRKVLAAGGSITTVAGTGTGGFNGDGQGLAVQLKYPTALCFDPVGDIVFGDYRRIRKLDTAGNVTTIAGTGSVGCGGDGGPAVLAQITNPWGLAVDGAGNIYFTDPPCYSVRRIDTAGIITTVAGVGTFGNSGDGGPALAAQLGYPAGVAVDCTGQLYISDFNFGRIRRIDTAGNITTLAGTTDGYSGDGGPADLAKLDSPTGLALDFYGDLYFCDAGNAVIRKVTNPSGANATISLVAGVPQSPGYVAGNTANAKFGSLVDLALDAYGNLFVTDSVNDAIRRIDTCYSSPLKCLSAPSPTPGPTPDLAKLGFVLHPYPNSPNPFADSGTFLAFFVSEDAEVSIEVYNVSGEKVRSISTFSVKAGDTEVPWNARNDGGQLVASGVYLVRFKAVSTVSGKEQSQFLKCSVAR